MKPNHTAPPTTTNASATTIIKFTLFIPLAYHSPEVWLPRKQDRDFQRVVILGQAGGVVFLQYQRAAVAVRVWIGGKRERRFKRNKVLCHPLIFGGGDALRDYPAVPVDKHYGEARLKVPVPARLPRDGKRAFYFCSGARTVEADKVCLLCGVAGVIHNRLSRAELPPRDSTRGNEHHEQYGEEFFHTSPAYHLCALEADEPEPHSTAHYY